MLMPPRYNATISHLGINFLLLVIVAQAALHPILSTRCDFVQNATLTGANEEIFWFHLGEGDPIP